MSNWRWNREGNDALQLARLTAKEQAAQDDARLNARLQAIMIGRKSRARRRKPPISPAWLRPIPPRVEIRPTWAERMAALKVTTTEHRAALAPRKWTRLLEPEGEAEGVEYPQDSNQHFFLLGLGHGLDAGVKYISDLVNEARELANNSAREAKQLERLGKGYEAALRAFLDDAKDKGPKQ